MAQMFGVICSSDCSLVSLGDHCFPKTCYWQARFLSTHASRQDADEQARAGSALENNQVDGQAVLLTYLGR